MDERGLSEAAVFKALENVLSKDARYSSGKILCSMCSEPLDTAKKAYNLAVEKNLGDESLFPGTAQIERDVVSMLGSLLSNAEAKGHIISGGTEANITALWVARSLDKKGRREILLPESAHFSFETAANLLELKLVKIPLTDRFTVDTSEVRKAVSRDTLAVIGIAGSTGLGTVDTIPELSDIALEHGAYLHIDATFGGFVLPFLQDLGLYKGIFDFKALGVKSISIDPHKMGLCPIPAGAILFRDESLLSAISRSVLYIGQRGPKFTTITGTRPGAPAVAVWTALKLLGRSGYRQIVKQCMENTLALADDLRQIDGVHLLAEPTMNILGFTCSGLDNRIVVDALAKKGWALSLFPTHIRVAVMPHTVSQHLKVFSTDLKTVLTQLR
ncbi:MAG: tyrosine decarboxylase MfnA [Thaumarchaeota archaeon]|nr:tyrosine decarboxylase MfnA [Nitrososphaerota archaeon]MCL5318687.1 tyrosine decarboxylase MfnA [Nitrososphaerota archaeon]